MKVYITPECHAQIMYYVHKSPIEISGLGRVQKASDGSLVVTKIYLLKQENTAASTDICEEAMSTLMFETREDKGSLNFWWHSHVDMGTFWSGTDMDTIHQFGKNGYLLSTVFNKKGEHRTSYYQGGTDFLPPLFVDGLSTFFSYLPTQQETEAWEADYKGKCAQKKWEAPATGKAYGAYGIGWGYGYDKEWEEASVPSSFKDKSYYESPIEKAEASLMAEEVIGINTGATINELVAKAKAMFYCPEDSIEKLDVMDQLYLMDMYEYIYDTQATEEHLQHFFFEVSGSLASNEAVVDMLKEAYDWNERVEREKAEPKGAVPVGKVVSYKGKTKQPRGNK